MKRRSRVAFPALSTIAGCAMTMTGFAQVAPATTASNAEPATINDQAAVLTEVVVTAQKTAQPLERTPIAIAAVAGNTLTEQGVTDMRGVADLVPSAQFQEDRGATKVYLRGVGTFLDVDSSDPAVATNIDEIYTPREATGGSLYDVKDVEVLYGPQGTLYGRNAMGGAVNISTNDPKRSLGANAFIEGGNYDFAHADGVLNAPLTESLAVRGAVDYQYHRGYLSDGMNDQKSVGARFKALYTPTDWMSLLAAAEYYHDGGNGDTPSYVVPSKAFPSSQSPWTLGVDPRVAGWVRNYYVRKYYAKARLNLGSGLTLVYIPAHLSYDDDSNFLNGPGSLLLHPEGKQDTQELRLQQTSRKAEWVVGAYWYDFDGTTVSNLTLAPIPVPYPNIGIDLTDVHTQSYAGFGQLTYSLSSALRAIAGIRYSDDKRTGSGANVFNAAPGLSFPAPFAAKLSSSRVDYRVGLQADLTRTTMMYATVSTGYTEGGFSPLASSGQSALIFRPETLRAYQLGSKNRLWDGHLEINDELYYYDLSDYQVSAFSQALGGLVVVNANKAQMYGNDLSVRAKVTDSDSVSLDLGLERARAIDFIIPASLVGASNACDCDGYTLPNAPGVTASVDYSHTFELPAGSSLVADVQSYYSASYWWVYNHPAQTASSAYTMTNLTLTYRPEDDRWYVALWGRNLENTAHYGSISSPSSQLTPTTGFITAPRTFGARVGVRF
jgi:iron complex outermembrane receptor protein